MNFLAHLFLSGTDENIIVGNMIADFIRNKEVENFKTGVQKGIKIHRFIDRYTDNHPQVRKGTHRLQPHHHKYSPVVIDLFYDHLLVHNWELYSNESIESFSNKMYDVLEKRMEEMPLKLKKRLPNMIASDWLPKYGTENGLLRVLEIMDRRTKFPSNFVAGIAHLKADFDYYNEEFNLFFPEMIESVNAMIKEE